VRAVARPPIRSRAAVRAPSRCRSAARFRCGKGHVALTRQSYGFSRSDFIAVRILVAMNSADQEKADEHRIS
jgi:hypothetical protein